MTRTEIVAAIANSAGISREQAKLAIEIFTDCVAGSLKAGNDVRLIGFGTFVAVERKAGMTRNPRTGQVMARAASRSARFRPGEGLRSALNG